MWYIEWENILTSYTSDGELIYRIYKVRTDKYSSSQHIDKIN